MNKNDIKKIFLATIIFLNFSYAQAAKSATIVKENLSTTLPKTVQKYLEDNFLNATFMFNEGDKILVHGANGVNSTEGTRLMVNQVMPIASNTKPMTAACILKLQEKKLLDVNDKLIKFFPENSDIWPAGKAPDWAHYLTIHNLLTHTSGLKEYFGIKMFDTSMSHKEINKKIIEYACNNPVENKAGEKYKYSSTNYVLLGMIIEKVSKKTLANYFQDEIFEPLGMKNTALGTLEEILKIKSDPTSSPYPQRYLVSLNDSLKPDFSEIKIDNLIVPYADGGVVSNSADLMKWFQGLVQNKVISKASFDLMTSKYYLIPTVLGNKTYTGYGLYISELSEGTKVIHGCGSIPGIRSEAGYIPSRDLYFSIISNVSVNQGQRAKINKNKINLDKLQNQLDIRYFLNYIFNSIGLTNNTKVK